MSNERDIDDILDSLNQLLREGESHNDDHVEEDASLEALEAKLHELDEEIDELKNEPPLPDEPVEIADESNSDSEPESDSIPEQYENSVPADLYGALDEDDEDEDEDDDEPADSPISIQRVVLTEEMLVNNPQGNLLSAGSGRSPSSTDTGKADLDSATEIVPEERVGEVPHTLLHVDHQHLEQLLEQVADDVIRQLQHELPTLIKRSLYHHLAQIRDGGQAETDSEENQRNREDE